MRRDHGLCQTSGANGTLMDMTKNLDVLVIGGPASETAEPDLQQRSHRTHRCHAVGKAPFPCIGVADPAACPLVGQVDVALLVRRGVHADTRPEEAGVPCVLRAGVPLVEDGLDTLDPYADWITSRVTVGGDVTETCVAAADRRHDELAALVRMRIGLLCASVGVHAGEVSCTIESEPGGLRIDLTVPTAIDRRLEHAFAVRALDAVRASSQNHGHVNVDVRGTQA
jgi:hypothetical protein